MRDSVQRVSWGRRFAAIVVLVLGLAMAVPGAYLLRIGGSAYYLLAGIALVTAAVLLWRNSRFGALLYGLILILTTLWAVWESGLDGWALLPRLALLAVIGWAILLIECARVSRRSVFAALGATVVLGTAAGVAGWIAWHGPAAQDHFATTQGPVQGESGEWTHIGGNQGARRFSELSQITPENVSGLKEIWSVHLGKPPVGMVGALEATPIKIRNMLFTCNMHNVVIALDAETGRTIWQADAQMDRQGVALAACRGVSYYRDPGASTGALCAERIIQTTYHAQLIALDFATGRRCPGFGSAGVVELKQGLGDVPKGYYYLTSPATVVRDRLVVGASVLDGQEIEEPSGVIRAFDARTGAFAWAWDMGRPGDHGMPPAGQTFTRGTPNAWAPMTGDDRSGMVFVPLGNATPDYLAAHRSDLMNRFASSVVALDATSGALRWSFQTTHRDVWDYDVASPPTLADFPTPDGPRPAVIQATKRGQIFVLDRMTGRPLVSTVERPVPQDGVRGEKLSPTQPYSVGMPALGGGRLSEARMWGITPLDQLWCRIKYREARYDGDFTPITERPTIVFPSYFGGSNWSGVAVDPQRKLLAVNVNYFAMYNRLIPRETATAAGIEPFRVGRNEFSVAAWPQGGTPYAAQTGGFVSPINVPCTQPPFGELAVIDLTTRKIAWRTKLGTARDSGPFGMALQLPIPMGTPALGGSLMTQTGLLFIAATQERAFRAFDSATGKLLWRTRLPAGGHSNPMTYYSNRSGRQFVLIAASGHPQLQSGSGDYLIAYALPKAN